MPKDSSWTPDKKYDTEPSKDSFSGLKVARSVHGGGAGSRGRIADVASETSARTTRKYVVTALRWENIANKPSTFPPSPHTHPLGDLQQSGATTGDVVKWSGSAWTPAKVDWNEIANKPSTFPPSAHAASHQHGGSDEVATATPTANAIPKADASGKLALGWIPAGVDAGKLQGRNVATTAPSDGQVLKWNATANQWEPGTVSGGGGGTIGGSIAAGQVAFGTGTNTIGGDNALWWDNTNKRLGLRQTSPSAVIDVQITSTSETAQITRATSGQTAALQLWLDSAGNEIASVLPTGFRVSNNYGVAFGNLTPAINEVRTIFPIRASQHLVLDSSIFSAGSIVFRANTQELARITNTGYFGLGTSNPQSTLHVQGSLSLPIITTTGNLTLDATHHTVLVNASAGAVTIFTGPAGDKTGRIYTIKKIDSSANTVTVQAAIGMGQTIDGSGTYTLTAQWQFVTIQSNGSNWFVIAKG